MAVNKETMKLVKELMAQCQGMHQLGDVAATQAAATRVRRVQRNRHSANRAWRNAATAAEATLFLTAVMDRGGSKAEKINQTLRQGSLMVADLEAEAFVLQHYLPQARKSAK